MQYSFHSTSGLLNKAQQKTTWPLVTSHSHSELQIEWVDCQESNSRKCDLKIGYSYPFIDAKNRYKPNIEAWFLVIPSFGRHLTEHACWCMESAMSGCRLNLSNTRCLLWMQTSDQQQALNVPQTERIQEEALHPGFILTQVFSGSALASQAYYPCWNRS